MHGACSVQRFFQFSRAVRLGSGVGCGAASISSGGGGRVVDFRRTHFRVRRCPYRLHCLLVNPFKVPISKEFIQSVEQPSPFRPLSHLRPDLSGQHDLPKDSTGATEVLPCMVTTLPAVLRCAVTHKRPHLRVLKHMPRHISSKHSLGKSVGCLSCKGRAVRSLQLSGHLVDRLCHGQLKGFGFEIPQHATKRIYTQLVVLNDDYNHPHARKTLRLGEVSADIDHLCCCIIENICTTCAREEQLTSWNDLFISGLAAGMIEDANRFHSRLRDTRKLPRSHLVARSSYTLGRHIFGGLHGEILLLCHFLFPCSPLLACDQHVAALVTAPSYGNNEHP